MRIPCRPTELHGDTAIREHLLDLVDRLPEGSILELTFKGQPGQSQLDETTKAAVATLVGAHGAEALKIQGTVANYLAVAESGHWAHISPTVEVFILYELHPVIWTDHIGPGLVSIKIKEAAVCA